MTWDFIRLSSCRKHCTEENVQIMKPALYFIAYMEDFVNTTARHWLEARNDNPEWLEQFPDIDVPAIDDEDSRKELRSRIEDAISSVLERDLN